MCYWASMQAARTVAPAAMIRMITIRPMMKTGIRNLVALQHKINLSIQSSLVDEECAHKLLNIQKTRPLKTILSHFVKLVGIAVAKIEMIAPPTVTRMPIGETERVRKKTKTKINNTGMTAGHERANEVWEIKQEDIVGRNGSKRDRNDERSSRGRNDEK